MQVRTPAPGVRRTSAGVANDMLVVTGESTWRLTHEGGNHAEREEELKKLKLDMGDARREVE